MPMPKRFITQLLIVCILLCICPMRMPAAGFVTELPEEMDQAYIARTIATMINALYADSLSSEITAEDVDLSCAYKIYVETNIFALETNSFAELLSHLENGTFIFEVPLVVGDICFVANLQILNPISEIGYKVMTSEQIAEYTEKIGTWDVTVLYKYDAEFPYLDIVERAANITGIESIRPILVGGLPGLIMPIAIYPDDAGQLKSVVITQANVVAWEELGLKANEVMGRSIDYVELKERVLRLPPQDSAFIGGGPGGDAWQRNYIPLFLMIITPGLLISVALIVIMRKRTTKVNSRP